MAFAVEVIAWDMVMGNNGKDGKVATCGVDDLLSARNRNSQHKQSVDMDN